MGTIKVQLGESMSITEVTYRSRSDPEIAALPNLSQHERQLTMAENSLQQLSGLEISFPGGSASSRQLVLSEGVSQQSLPFI